MKISFALKESIYNCKVQITDLQGSRAYLIPAVSDDELSEQCITADIYGTEFDLTLIPMMPDIEPVFNELEEHTWKDRLVKKVTKFLVSSLDKMMLRVGCVYHVDQIQDGDRLDLALQTYAFGTFDRFNLLELFPVAYMFFEVFREDKRFSLTTAFETNRKEVLKAARRITLAGTFGLDFLLTLIFAYPIQIGRVKRLTKRKKILKTLTKFNKLSDMEREKFLKKQEECLDR